MRQVRVATILVLATIPPAWGDVPQAGDPHLTASPSPWSGSPPLRFLASIALREQQGTFTAVRPDARLRARADVEEFEARVGEGEISSGETIVTSPQP
jgi:hypothetical protein